MNSIFVGKKYMIWGFAILIILISILLILHFIFCCNIEPFAQIGSFGGLFISLYATFLLFKTLITQKDTLVEQKRIFEIESFENKFFNLLKTQREIANELKAYFAFINSDFIERLKSIEGREIFINSISELTKIWKAIISIKYVGQFDEESAKNTLIEMHELLESDLDTFLKAERKENLISSVKLRLTNKTYNITEDDWNGIKKMGEREKIIFLSNRFFMQYSYAFGHYYRHLYLIINFVDHLESESVEKKKNYINFVEAQMSPIELALLFYYSASNLEFLKLLKKFSFFEHLTDRDLIDPSHSKIQF
jgi:hypothetical protein